MGVLSNDFATVEIREELCYPQPPEKASGGIEDACFPATTDKATVLERQNVENKNQKEESHARRKSGSRSPSGSAGTAPLRGAFGLVFFAFVSWRVLVLAKHTPQCQIVFCPSKQSRKRISIDNANILCYNKCK